MIRKSFSILFLWLFAMVGVAQTDGYDPVNPPNPDVQATTYLLATSVQPAQAGSTNVSGSKYSAGSSVYVYTYNNNGYVFKHWTDGTNIVSTETSFYYTMPAGNAHLTAVYEYNPNSPDNPSGDYTRSHALALKASPSQGGSFNYNNNGEYKQGQQLSLYAYSNTHYVFKHWEYQGKVVSTDRNYNFTMPDVNAELVAVFEYSPSSPKDPGTNSWNAETGELIVDAFEQDNLSGAIYDVTGGNTDQVQTLIVNGKVSNYDIGNMANYPFSLVDFSRCAGATYVPSWSYEGNTTLTSISLPASITNIEYYAFSNCTSLTSVSCYATVPPTLGTNVFNGIKEQLVVFVPATSIDLYQEAAGWKDMTILPLSSQVNALEVNLPAGSDDGRFKNMFIELVNANSGQRMRYVISDRTAYTFQNLMHNTKWNVYVKNATGQVLGQMENIEMQTSDRSVTFQSLIEPQTIKAVVKTPDGTDVSGQMAFTWMTADGTYLAQGASVSGILPIDDAAVILRATLPQALAMQYQLLSDTTFVVQTSGNTITQTLVALPTAKLTGTVRDVLTNAVLGGANVTVSQTLNGKYSKAFTTTANAQGVYSLDAFYAPTSITAVATDYISQTVLYDSLTIENGVATLEDIALKSINGATITLNFTYTPAALSGSAAETQTYYSDYQNVAYAIRDITTGQDIKQFNVQYPQIVLLEDVALGDSLQLTATSKTGSFMPVVAKGKVNDMNRAEVTFDIKQLGQISATFVSTENSAVNGILYDSKGKFVKNVAYSNAALSFKELTDGDYTLITMGNSKLFNTIYDLSKFEQAGLKDGTDYVATPVKVQSGVISAVKTSYVPFFDESKLYYTGDNTSFTVNKTQVTAGNYLTINSRIDFKSLYANEVSNVRLVVDLPSTCSLVDNSVMVGSGLSTYISAAGRVTIPVDNLNDRIRFCVIPTAGGDYAPSAYVQFTYNDQDVTQPIGNANFTVKDLSINVPKTVARTSVPISGTAVGKSKVEIYDNGMLIGETISLANGTWATTCELFQPENLSTHQIYAKVTTLMGLEMQSETMACLYDKDAVQVNKVTMINTAHPATSLNLCNYVTVFDFQDPQKPIAPYWYWPSYPDFTFLVDIDYNDVQLIPFVWLHVFTSDGNTRSLRVNYDESKDCWITTAKFTSEALPTRVSVTIENMVFDPSIDATYEVLMDEYVGDIELNETVEGEDGSTTSTYTDGNGDDIASVTSYESDETVDDLLNELKEDGFVEDELLDDDSDYVPEDDEDVLDEDVKVLTDPESGSMAFIVPGITTKPYVVIVRLIQEEGKESSTELISSIITREWKSFFRTYFDPATCSQITEYLKYTEHLDKYVTIITSSRVAYTLFVDYTKLPPGTKIPRKQILAKIRRIRHSSKRYTTKTKEVTVVPKSCPPPPPPPPPLPPHHPICPVMDPSGYVYEGVHSNRLEGVTATAYYKETGEDMYGDPYEKEVLWDAAEYAQENPLFTDEFGMYAWDVPQGLWRVKFEKEGYQTTYSEWLPVPPPQLDVNIAMTQDRQPEVKEAKAYEDGVEIEFDKYMLPENLTTDNIIVKKNGEKIEDGTIELLNAENPDGSSDGDNGAKQAPSRRASGSAENVLASKVKFVVPDGTQLLSTDEVTLIVTTGVKSYVGLPMQETYTQTFDVEKAVRKISADSLLTVLYEGTRTLQVSALPGDAAAGKTLRVRPLSTLIADISGEGLTLQEDGSSTITLDEEGQATLTVSGELPGSTALQFSIDDTKAEGQTLVKVQQAASLVTPNPRASRASGSAVYRGTLISLSCEDENAKIWYTLDGTCPCDPATALVYSQPIAINDDAVTIKAMAQAEGFEESEVVTFEYTAKKNNQELALSEGWTWISHNVANNLAVSTFPEKTLELKSQTRGVIRDAVLGLFGNLQELTPTEAYKVKMSASATLPVSGDAFNASKGIISLSKGWNWIGYPMDQIMTPTEALTNLSAAEGDMLVGLSGSADFIDGAWIGDLETMTPGLGYMLKTSAPAELLYNTGIVSKAASLTRGRLNINRSPWSVDEHRYSNVMPMRAQLFRESGQTDDDEYTVAAFAGTECRGIGKYVQGVIFMNVHGEGAEDITFQAVHNEKEYIVDIQETLPFKSDAVGSYREPYVLHLGDETVGVAERYSQLGVWPTMAMTEITVSLSGKPIDRLTLTSTDGKMVRAKASGLTQEIINVTNLPAGVYIVAAQSGNEYFYKKIMKVNK
ncbi:MAG: chitobiase/beta-hexosaminidase C-terminal domain-containing protein [Bacteroidaceae bacterium]|nr:chitobiase/beta-hexosaminidase C-terminal domain-containing protein [Bacteroidaceae bacterium]